MEVQLVSGLQDFAEVVIDPLLQRRNFSAYQANRHNQPKDHIRENRNRAVQSAKIFSKDKRTPSKSALGLVEKEEKERQIISLKNQNHLLKKQNQTMKFKIDNLEKKLKEKRDFFCTLDTQTNLVNIKLLNLKDEKIQQLIKQLKSVQSEFVRIKKSVRYTSRQQVQILKETIEQQSKRLRIKTEKVWIELQEQRKQTQKLRKQLKEIKVKLKKGNHSDEKEGKLQDFPNRQIMIYSKEKEMEIETLKKKVVQLEQKINRRPQPQKQFKYVSQKLNIKVKICLECQKLKKQNQQLKQRLQYQIKNINCIRIHQPSQSESQCVRMFLALRFKAHGLSLDDVLEKHMFPRQSGKTSDCINIGQLRHIISLIPFRITNNRYIQIFIYMLFQEDKAIQVIMQSGKMMKKQIVRQNFITFMADYQLFTKDNELELFGSISQYLQKHQQFIFKKLFDIEQFKNGLSLTDFRYFFTQIVEDNSLIQTIIEYMLIQIINASEDLDHLSIQRLFQVFCTSEEI